MARKKGSNKCGNAEENGQKQQPSLFFFWGRHKMKNPPRSPPGKATNKKRKINEDPASQTTTLATEEVPADVLAQRSPPPVTTTSSNSDKIAAHTVSPPTNDDSCESSPATGPSSNHVDSNDGNKAKCTLTAGLLPAKSTSVVDFMPEEGEGSMLTKQLSTSDGASMDVESDDSKSEGYSSRENTERKDDASAEAVAARNDNDGDPPLSEYELLRLRNIARNNARLEELGFSAGNKMEDAAAERRKQQRKQKQRRKKKKTGDASITATAPTRRSRRIRKSLPGEMNEGELLSGAHETQQQDVSSEAAHKEEEEQFEVSPVVQYAMDQQGQNVTPSCCEASSDETKSSEVTSLVPVGSRLLSPQGLGAIYTMQFYTGNYNSLANNGRSDSGINQNTAEQLELSRKSWLVGAGKSGIVALWDCNWSCRNKDAAAEDGIDPILSWKAHGGRWISDARFLPPPSSSSSASTASPSRLVTAANDGTLCVWDLTTVSVQSGAPKLLYRTGKELHTSGIFAMDVNVTLARNEHDNNTADVVICTGSKDKTVAVTSLESIARGSGPMWKCDYHTGKVGAIKLQPGDSSTLASASDDGRVAIHDYRIGGRSSSRNPAAVLDGAHNRPHTVVWDPLCQHVLMTAGLDDVIKTWDVRCLSQPQCTFRGHVPLKTRCKKIHHPTFYVPRNRHSCFILTGGEGSHALSMFKRGPFLDKDENMQTVYSRGALPTDCGDAGCIAVDSEKVAAAVDGGEVLLLAPHVQ